MISIQVYLVSSPFLTVILVAFGVIVIAKIVSFVINSIPVVG